MSIQEENNQSQLKINMLGGFVIYINGEILPDSYIKGRKAKSLLKLIAHQQNYQMPREQVIETLWPELVIQQANSQLYKAIHHIRNGFAGLVQESADWITITDNLIRLSQPGAVITDLQQFGHTARNGLQNQHVPDLEMAISIYTGDFLPTDPQAEWATFPRQHYRQLYLDVLTALATRYEQQGDLLEAAEMLHRALEKEPTLEAAHRGLMRIFARKGQTTRAYHQFDLCRKILADELGMNPSAETKKILDDVREGQFTRQVERYYLSPSVPEPVPPVFGRMEEINAINKLLDQLSNRKSSALIIEGEIGTGKSRLIQELILLSRRKEIPFFMGRAGKHTGITAYQPFVELFDDILHKYPELANELPAEIGYLIPRFPGNGDTFTIHADKLAAKGYLFAHIQRFLAHLANDQPLVIMLEDMHAADQGSMEMLSYLFQHKEQFPVLFVTTYRQEVNEPEKSSFHTLQSMADKDIELGPLSFEAHNTLLHHHAAKAGITLDSADEIFRLSEGNPLFALELLRFYAEENRASSLQTSNATASNTSTFAVKIPPSLQHIIEQMMEGLSAPAYQLLYMAATIGPKIPYELMASVWREGQFGKEETLFDALEEVMRARLLEESGLDYTFRRALIREVIYSSISEARRKMLHKLVTKGLIDISGHKYIEPVSQIGNHYLCAGETLQGAEYLVRAGKQAERAYAHEDALQLYHKACEAIECLETTEARQLHFHAMERIADTYRTFGHIENSYDAYIKAIDLAGMISLNNQEMAELHRKMAVAGILRTDMARSEKYLSNAFELAGDEEKLQARLYITKALHLWHLNQLRDAYDQALQALALAEKLNAAAEASQACEMLAMTCLPMGRWQEGLKYEMQRKLHGWSPEVVVATDAHLCLWEYHVSGDEPLRQARSFLEQVSQQASEQGNLRCVAVCHYALGTMYLWRGERRQAVDELTSSLDLHGQVGSPAGMAYSLARKSVLHTLMGAAELGWQAVQKGLDHARQASVRDHCLQRLYGVGIWNRVEANDHENARELVKQSTQLLEESGACGACALELYPWLAYYYLLTNQIEQARECGNIVSELASQTGNPIGKAIASMIRSSLCVVEARQEKAEQYSRESFGIVENAIAEAKHSPVIHYLQRMVQQQPKLRKA